jgi:ATP-dependent DNA helicase RecQ
MLLRYFGEESKDDCGQCDVCLSRRNDPEEQQAFEDAKKYILDLLNSSDRVNIRDLNNAPFAYRHIEAAMQFLIDERIATHHDFYLYLNR